MFVLYLILVMVSLVIAIFIPRKKPLQELIITLQFAIILNSLTDMYLDDKYNLYWYFNEMQVEWKYLFIVAGEAIVLYIVFNYFPLFSNHFRKFIYISAWTFIFVLLELFTVYLNILHYRNWSILYSAVVYFITLYVLYLVYKFARRLRN